MIPNDVARCQGAATEYIDAGILFVRTKVAMHPQCIGCARRTDVLPDREYSWMAAPLGLLTEPDEICEMRRG